MPGASLPRSITASISRRPTPAFWAFGIDRDRPDAPDRIALVEEVRADDPPVDLGDHAPHLRVRDPRAHHRRGGLERGEVPREAVVIVDVAERLEDDARKLVGIGGLGRSKGDLRGCA